MDIFFDIHKNLPREGPGDSSSTARAFALLQDLPHNPLILDIGCGPGMQTIDLAHITSGKIIAVDNHQPYLSQLQHRIQKTDLKTRIALCNASMFELPFPQNSFDCIWSEGAIYFIGFENGLRACRNLLKPGGSLAVTEISWLRPNPPQEVYSYWMAEYPGMRAIAENLAIAQRVGYHDLGHFTLPASSWWTDYYTPIEKRLPELREKCQGQADANECLDATQIEMDMHRKYSEWYGYVFYVLKVI